MLGSNGTRRQTKTTSSRGSGSWSWRGTLRSHSEPAARRSGAALSGLILPGSTLDQDRVAPAFKPPFDIIHRIAQEARRATQGIRKQASEIVSNACPILLPRPDSN